VIGVLEVREIEIILPFNRTSAKAEQHISPIAQWLGIAVRLPAPVSFVVGESAPISLRNEIMPENQLSNLHDKSGSESED